MIGGHLIHIRRPIILIISTSTLQTCIRHAVMVVGMVSPSVALVLYECIIMVMEITAIYIWSQIFTVIEYGLLGSTYFAKKRRLIVVLDIFSMLAGIIAYILLGADAGLAMSVVILLANFYYLLDEKRRGKNHKLQARDFVVLAIVLLVIGILAGLTYDGPLSLLSVAATVLYEVSIWQNSPKVYKFLGIPVALCWMLYNVFVFSVAGIVSEGIVFLAATVGYLRAYHAEKLAKLRRRKKRK